MEIKVLDTSNPTQLAIIGRVDTVTADEVLKISGFTSFLTIVD